MEKENIVELKNVSVAFDGEQVLDGLDLEIKDKEFITLLHFSALCAVSAP